MARHPCINAVLNDSQLDFFCDLFGLKPSQIEVCTDGWFKNVLLADDRAYLFPRDPRGVPMLACEMDIYRAFAEVRGGSYPRLIERVKDRNISYYEFAVVSRLSGSSFRVESGLDEIRNGAAHRLDPDRLERYLVALARKIAEWHELSTSGMEFRRDNPRPIRVSRRNWQRQALIPSQTEAAVKFLARLLSREAKVTLAVDRLINMFAEIAEMKPVLVHGDVHEDQLLVTASGSPEISGVLDWEAARIANPVWDFDFGEWGLEIWHYHEHLPRLRKAMWEEYLRCRNLEFGSYDGIDAYWTFQELLVVISRPDETDFEYTRKNYEDTIQFYIDKIRALYCDG